MDVYLHGASGVRFKQIGCIFIDREFQAGSQAPQLRAKACQLAGRLACGDDEQNYETIVTDLIDYSTKVCDAFMQRTQLTDSEINQATITMFKLMHAADQLLDTVALGQEPGLPKSFYRKPFGKQTTRPGLGEGDYRGVPVG